MIANECINCPGTVSCTTMKVNNDTTCPCFVCIVKSMCAEWCEDAQDWWGKVRLFGR